MKQDVMLEKIYRSAENMPTPESLEPECILGEIERKAAVRKRKKISTRVFTVAGAVAACFAVLVFWKVSLSSPLNDGAGTKELETLIAAAPAAGLQARSYAAGGYDDIYEKLKTVVETPQAQTFGAASGMGLMSPGKENTDDADRPQKWVKADRDYLYVEDSENNQVQIIKLSGLEMKEAGRITVEEGNFYGTIYSFYANGDELSIIWSSQEDIINIDTYDVSDPSLARMTGRVLQNGTYVDSVQKGDYVYVYSAKQAELPEDKSEVNSYIPTVNGNPVAYDDIYIPETVTSGDFVLAVSIDMKSPDKTTDAKAVMVDRKQVYATKSGFYAGLNQANQGTETDQGAEPKKDIDSNSTADHPTTLLSVSCDGGKIRFENTFELGSRLAENNPFHSIGSNLAVLCTKTGEAGDGYSLYVLDETMNLLGKVEDLASGELIENVEWIGERGYFVIDSEQNPLICVDLSDAKAPVVSEQLGFLEFSGYWAVYGEDQLLQIRAKTDPQSQRQTEISITMSDISSVDELTEIHKMRIGGNLDSPAFYRPETVFVSQEKNLIGFPVRDVGSQTGKTGEYQLLSYNETSGFRSFAVCDLTGANLEMVRTINVGDWIYVVEENRIQAFSLTSPAQVGELSF